MREGAGRLVAMARVTGAARAAALGRLAAATARRGAIARAIATLDAERRAAAADVTDPATRAGATLLWQGRAEQHRRSLVMALALARAAENEAREAAARALGRDEAVKSLQGRGRGRR